VLEEHAILLRKALASAEASYAAGIRPSPGVQSNLGGAKGSGNWRRRAICCARRWPRMRRAMRRAIRPSPLIKSTLAGRAKGSGEVGEARDLLKKAYATALARLGSNHPTTRTIRANLGSLKDKEGGGD